MNYAVPTDRVFSTSKPIKRKTKISAQSRSIREFCASHTVRFERNASTGEITARAIEVKGGK